MNPFVVGFTQGTGAIAAVIAVHTAGAGPAVADAFARKNTPDFARNEYEPLAFVRTRPSRLRRFARGPAKMLTVAPARG